MKNRFGRPKVFCIGFNKTGTSSLHEFFTQCGLKSVHNTRWPHHSRIKSGKPRFRQADCYSDGERADFAQLRHWFPDAVFILNTRADMPWIRSRLKHVFRRNEKIDLRKILDDARYQTLARDFFFDPGASIARWYMDKRIYERQARIYFADDPAFLEIDITTTEDWADKVHDLLQGRFASLKKPDNANIAKNVRESTRIEDTEALDKYCQLAEGLIATLDSSVPPAAEAAWNPEGARA